MKCEYVRASNLDALLELARVEDEAPIAKVPLPARSTTTATTGDPVKDETDVNSAVRHYLPRLMRMEAACAGHLAEFSPRLTVLRREALRDHPEKSLKGYYVRHGGHHDFTSHGIFLRIRLWYWYKRDRIPGPEGLSPIDSPHHAWDWKLPGAQALMCLVREKFREDWEGMGIAAKDAPERWR